MAQGGLRGNEALRDVDHHNDQLPGTKPEYGPGPSPAPAIARAPDKADDWMGWPEGPEGMPHNVPGEYEDQDSREGKR